MVSTVPETSTTTKVSPDSKDLQSGQPNIAKAQAILRRYIPEGYLLSEELIRDRRTANE